MLSAIGSVLYIDNLRLSSKPHANCILSAIGFVLHFHNLTLLAKLHVNVILSNKLHAIWL